MGAQQSADSCRKYFVDTANRAMVNLGMQSAECCFLNSGSNKGVRASMQSQPQMLQPQQTFRLHMMPRGAPKQSFRSSMRQAKSAKPSVAIYDDIKADPPQEVVTTFCVEDSVGISGRTAAEKIARCSA
ncbi:TPA: hypothetical protein ACH3X3_004909 [Trebouxia sp. C0006]